MRQSINTVFRIAGGMRTPARRPVSSPDKAFIARFGRFFGGRNHFLPRMPFGDGRGRRLLQPLRRASAREMPRLRRAESARDRVPLRLRQSDSRAASRRAPVQPAAAVRARPMSALLQDERARLRVLLLMRAAPRRTAAESGRRRILLRALQAEPRAVGRRRLLRERERRRAGGVWIRAC